MNAQRRRIKRQIEKCSRCKLACDHRVTESAPARVDIAIITASPDFEAVSEQRGLGGLRRRIVESLLLDVGLGDAGVFFTSLVSCHSFGLHPTDDEVVACSDHLAQRLALATPEVIVFSGRRSALMAQSRLFPVTKGGFRSSINTGLVYQDPWGGTTPVLIAPELEQAILEHHHLSEGLHPETPLAHWVKSLRQVRRYLADKKLQSPKSDGEIAQRFETQFCPWPTSRIPDVPEALTQQSNEAKGSGDARGKATAFKAMARWRAAAMDIHPSELKDFRTIFVAACFTEKTGHRIKWDPRHGDWHTDPDYYPPLNRVAMHLSSEAVMSSFFSKSVTKTQVALIDADAHDDYQRAMLSSTLATLRRLFLRGLFVRLSPSGGFHVYLFFRRPHDAKRLRQLIELKLAKMGLLRHRIAAHVSVQLTEVLVGPGRGGRLPFGFGSWPLEPGFGEHSTPREMLGYLWEFTDDKRNILRLEEVFGAELRQLRRTGHRNLGRLLRRVTEGDDAQHERAGLRAQLDLDPHRELFRHCAPQILKLYLAGIDTFGTRRRQTYLLARFLLSRGCNSKKAADILTAWFRRRPHRSKDWLNDPDQVIAELPTIVTAASNFVRVVKAPSLDDVRFMLDATVDCTPTRRRMMLTFGFELLRFILQHGRLVQPMIDRNPFQKASNSAPTVQPRIEAQVFWKLLKEWGGDHYSERLMFWSAARLVRKVKKHSVSGGKATTFQLLVSTAGEGTPVFNLWAALAALLPKDDEVHHLFGRTTAKRIIGARDVSGQ